MNIRTLRSGFTLIELLVTISIIGILAAIVYANFGDAKEDAKNKALRAEVKEMQLAIELYKAQNGQYPEAASTCDFEDSGFYIADSASCGSASIISGLVPDFIAALPSPDDSGNPNCNYLYFTDTNNTKYKLIAHQCIVAESQAVGIKSTDEMAMAPSGVGSCNLTNPGTYQSSSAGYYQSLSVYSLGGECPSF